MRGPLLLPGPLTPGAAGPGESANRRRDRFDLVVLDVVEALVERLREDLAAVEFAVEEVPVLPADWSASTVPLASVVRHPVDQTTKVVLFRRPLELRAQDAVELAALIRMVLVEQVAELLDRRPEDVDPGYEPGSETG